MQSNVYPLQFKREVPSFNIRKLARKPKNGDDMVLTPETEHEKFPESATYSNGKREKEVREREYSLDDKFEQETMVINSRAYQQMKTSLQLIRRKNAEDQSNLKAHIKKSTEEKQKASAKYQKLLQEKDKCMNTIALMHERLLALRENNRRFHEMTQNRMSSEAEYLANLIMSMRFQAEYEHDIDPDQMSYEQLLELEQKIGSVSKGVKANELAKLQKLKRQVKKHTNNEIGQDSESQMCTICYSPYEEGQFKTKINCSHDFHHECIKSWLQKEKVCPNCKQEIKLE